MSETPKVMPRYEVEPIEGKAAVQMANHKAGTGFEYQTEKEDFGYMVYFPAGHSIRVQNEKELQRLGFHRVPGRVNMETGDELSPDMDPEELSPKAAVMRATKGKPMIAPLPSDEEE